MTLATFKKLDAAKQIVYAEVYAPMAIDTQGDFMTGDDIEGIAHDFMGSGKVRNIDTNHDGVPNGSYAVESFVAKSDDKTFVPGSWVLGVKVPNKGLWQQIEQGVYKAFSMEGSGRREPMTLNGKPANRLTGVTVNSVSIVKRGACGQEYKLMKSDTSLQEIGKAFEQIAAQIQATTEAITKGFEQQQAQIDALSATAGGRVVRKAEPMQQQNPEVNWLLRKRARLQGRLEAVWEDPTQYPDVDEADLRRRISKAEDRLHELGHETERATLDSGSAFLHRGGRSDFLVASPMTLDEVLGVRRVVSKSDENAIEVENCLVL